MAFYPMLLGPGGRMAFVRVSKSRITYVWRGVRWGAPHEIGGRAAHLRASFPDNQLDGSNLVLTFGWAKGAETGYQLRLRFDGKEVLPVAAGRLVGDPRAGGILTEIVEGAYEHEDAWHEVLSDVVSAADNPRGFMKQKEAASFFPSGWLRFDHVKFLGESILWRSHMPSGFTGAHGGSVTAPRSNEASPASAIRYWDERLAELRQIDETFDADGCVKFVRQAARRGRFLRQVR